MHLSVCDILKRGDILPAVITQFSHALDEVMLFSQVSESA